MVYFGFDQNVRCWGVLARGLCVSCLHTGSFGLDYNMDLLRKICLGSMGGRPWIRYLRAVLSLWEFRVDTTVGAEVLLAWELLPKSSFVFHVRVEAHLHHIFARSDW